ncbi:MAG: glycosyltransferase [Bacteroidota bacterium]
MSDSARTADITPETNVILYNSSSFGGCYDYALALLPHFAGRPEVKKATLLLTKNSAPQGKNIDKPLLPDIGKGKSTLAKKLYFIYRSFINPLILLAYLRKTGSSLVIFNDFEQISAIIWVPLFKLLLPKNKHRFAIILHDPDRDAYPPNLAFTTFSMKLIMSIMDLGLYHEYLPEKPYYQGERTRYLAIPHGILPSAQPDMLMRSILAGFREPGSQLAAIVGNIRAEKNYHLAIASLPKLPNLRLVFAGRPANSNVDPEVYQKQAEALGVDDRILWIERFLGDAEMSAIIQESDILLLYYARSFTSQSGIMNLLAPFMKKTVISDGESSLATLTRRYGIGVLAEPDNQQALDKALADCMALPEESLRAGWKNYLAFADWDNNVGIVMKAFKELPR